MTLNEKLETLKGQPYNEILVLLQSETTPVVSKIEGENVRDLMDLLTNGLLHRIENAPHSEIRTALLATVNFMTATPFGLNFGAPTVLSKLEAAVDAGLVLPAEKDKILELATSNIPLWPNITLHDVIAYFDSSLTDVGQWTELEYVGGRLALTLTQRLPEPSLVRIEACESIDGQTWTTWKRISHFYDVQESGLYLAEVPRSQLQRRIRWRGEYYKVVGTVAGV